MGSIYLITLQEKLLDVSYFFQVLYWHLVYISRNVISGGISNTRVIWVCVILITMVKNVPTMMCMCYCLSHGKYFFARYFLNLINGLQNCKNIRAVPFFHFRFMQTIGKIFKSRIKQEFRQIVFIQGVYLNRYLVISFMPKIYNNNDLISSVWFKT